MNDGKISVVDITIGANMYGRISDITNTPSHVLAEFVDNAIQSYKDKKAELQSQDSNYKLRVDISFEWDPEDDNRASKIIIKDNAGGIGEDKFVEAFKLAHTPDDNSGLNEFGMGMKTAALWLGEIWSVESSAIGEDISRKIVFDLNSVMANELKTLPVTHKPEYINEHYTLVTISSPTKNIPSIKSLQKIKDELASIYRKYLRTDEIEIIVNGQKLSFEDPIILTAPFHKKPGTPEGDKLYWKKDIDFRFGKYRATGFIAILKTIQQTKNGLALLRRGRVVVGADTDGRYYPKVLFGAMGNFRFKRLFGELELEGFDVAFNKNDIQDRENLEMLRTAISRQAKNSTYVVNGTQYTLNVQFVESGKDLVWIAIDKAKDGEIICNINTSHPYFSHFGKPTPAIIALLKTMAIAKFIAMKKGNDSTAELMQYFNEFILKTKV